MKYAGVPVFSRAFIKWLRCLIKCKYYRSKSYSSLQELINEHFRVWSEPNHRTRFGLEYALLSARNLDVILETGTSAWGCDSSRLFDAIVKYNHGIFFSVDIRPEASQWLKHQTQGDSRFFVEDSVNFIKKTLTRQLEKSIGFVYLDSFDLDFSDPEPSELHCLQEFRNLQKFLSVGSIIAIDDTYSTLEECPQESFSLASDYQSRTGRIPGKGSLVLEEIADDPCYKIVWNSGILVIKTIMNPNSELAL